MSKVKLNHVSILTGDHSLAKAVEKFYQDNFGMTVVRRGYPPQNQDWVYLKDNIDISDGWLEIVAGPIDDREKHFLQEHGPGLDHICLIVDDVDKTCANLQSDGVQIDIQPFSSITGARMAFFRDPAGSVIQVLKLPM